MEKIKCICVMREVMKALADFENALMEAHSVSLNEAMVLCAVGNSPATASFVAEQTGLRPSHTSKVVASLEDKGFITRELGKQDKRQICLSLTNAGKEALLRIKAYSFDIPEVLQPLFDAHGN